MQPGGDLCAPRPGDQHLTSARRSASQEVATAVAVAIQRARHRVARCLSTKAQRATRPSSSRAARRGGTRLELLDQRTYREETALEHLSDRQLLVHFAPVGSGGGPGFRRCSGAATWLPSLQPCPRRQALSAAVALRAQKAQPRHHATLQGPAASNSKLPTVVSPGHRARQRTIRATGKRSVQRRVTAVFCCGSTAPATGRVVEVFARPAVIVGQGTRLMFADLGTSQGLREGGSPGRSASTCWPAQTTGFVRCPGGHGGR